MKTLQIIKRAFLVSTVALTMGVAALDYASASVSNETPVERPMAGDGQETHGGKG